MTRRLRICRMAPHERRAAVEDLVAELVNDVAIVTYDGQRDPEHPHRVIGRLIGVARPLTGSQADVLVVHARTGAAGGEARLFAISLATVIDVERWQATGGAQAARKLAQEEAQA